VERKELDVFSEVSNYGIVRMSGRNFPGCVIQGDSLAILVRNARAILDRARASQDQELIELSDELAHALSDRLLHYESVLKQHSMDLPYAPVLPQSGGPHSGDR
jgi:hypothetical protein